MDGGLLLMMDCSAPATKILTRHEMEMGIQIDEMEKYKWICSEQNGCDVGRIIYLDWAQKFGAKVRQWLETLSDQEVQQHFQQVSEKVKNYIYSKSR